MRKEFIFKTNALFESVKYNQDADSWYFNFSDNIFFYFETFWRLLKNKNIHWVSLDNRQQFGLTEPIDLVEKLTSELKGKRLIEIRIKEETADLFLSLTENLEIEVFISSSGYESYNFVLDKKNYFGMGSGYIEIQGKLK